MKERWFLVFFLLIVILSINSVSSQDVISTNQQVIGDSCNSCGDGLFNVCDIKECENLGENCIFEKNRLGGNCQKSEMVLSEVRLFDRQSRLNRISDITRLGQREERSGRISAVIYDDFENERSEMRYSLRGDDGKDYRIYFRDEPLLRSGERLTIKGSVLKNEIAAEDFTKEEVQGGVAQAEDNPNLGEQRTAVKLKIE